MPTSPAGINTKNEVTKLFLAIQVKSESEHENARVKSHDLRVKSFDLSSLLKTQNQEGDWSFCVMALKTPNWLEALDIQPSGLV